MKNIEDINKAAIQKITDNKKITDFSPGDTIKVGVKIVEGKRERIQYFEGVCIAKKNRDLNSSFTVRKISFGEGVERTFALYSPIVDTIKVIRSGKVRRAKLYYLRDRTGKSARITEKIKEVIHPLVRIHPENKKICLYINPIRIEKIIGLTDNETLALLDNLMSYVYKKENEYRHKWLNGDFVIWDNRILMHKANGDYDMNEDRYLFRIMIQNEIFERT